MSSFPTQYSYLYGKPEGSALIRSCNEDFQVVEQLGFEPEGEGEHLFLYIRKNGENTDWVARQLARFCQISPRDVGYAGKKDRHAVTEQWFSVALPQHRVLNWNLFGGDTIEVLKTARHPRKLRLGALQGNRFRLRLRDVTHPEELVARLELIKQGVPNYFGEQRFGQDGGNLQKGLELLRGERKERQRAKKGMYISAVRSWCFNHLLSQRIDQNLWSTLLAGDALMLSGSKSTFVAEAVDPETVQRLADGDVNLTGAMWGRGEPLNIGDSRQWEAEQLQPWSEVLERLEHLGLRQERRSLRLQPLGLEAEAESERQWWLQFELPSGAFATSVLRELVEAKTAEQNTGE